MSAWTKGPWSASFDETGGYDCMTGAWKIYDASERTVCEVDQAFYGQELCKHEFRSHEAAAVAQLLSAAPDLAEACEAALEHMVWTTKQGNVAYQQLTAALRKARGEG